MVHLNAEFVNGDRGRLRELLERAVEAGADGIELHPSAFYCIRDGVLDERVAGRWASVLAEYPLSYSTHAPFTTPHTREPDLARRMNRSLLDFSELVSSHDLVLHPSQDRPADRLRLREVETLREVAGEGTCRGIRVHLENLPPFADNPDYTYGEEPAAVASVVDELGPGMLGMCLDIGHAGISAGRGGRDLVSDVAGVARLVDHVHWHDNYGKPCARTNKKWVEMTAQGTGDIHLVPGWGSLPLDASAGALLDAGFSGLVVVEIRVHFRDEWEEALAAARQHFTR